MCQLWDQWFPLLTPPPKFIDGRHINRAPVALNKKSYCPSHSEEARVSPQFLCLLTSTTVARCFPHPSVGIAHRQQPRRCVNGGGLEEEVKRRHHYFST